MSSQIFYHRVTRKIKKDGIIAYAGNHYELPYELIRPQVILAVVVVDPHRQQALFIESVDGIYLGAVKLLEAQASPDKVKPCDKKPNANNITDKPYKEK